MNFVAQLEDYLRDLGAEARKKHPGVKEASERAILKLRTLQNQYVSAVRKASNAGQPHPDTSLFQSSDLLHPFLLAANYPNASPKLLDTSFRAMKTLMEANAIVKGDGMNMVRVWMIQAQVVVSYSKESNKEKGITSNPDALTSTTASTPSGTGWLGSLLSSSASSSDAPRHNTNSVVMKTAVSSSHGQAGKPQLAAKDLEKLALDILSCLLQLLQLRDLPVTAEQWTQSVTLCRLLWLPNKPVVRQAAHSTLPQVLALLVQQDSKLAAKTWEDLLHCTLTSANQKKQVLAGAFAHCKLGEKDAAQPPSVSLSLGLLTTLLKEHPSIFVSVGSKTLGVVVQALQRMSTTSATPPLEYVGLLQFVLVILQTQSADWSTECRELLIRVIQPIQKATEALRSQADFEDGFVYKQAIAKTSAPPSGMETLRGMPITILYKAGLSMELLQWIVQDAALRPLWIKEDVLVQLLEATSDFCTIGASCKEHMTLLVAACRQTQGLMYPAESMATTPTSNLEWWQLGKGRDGEYILGDALWIGFGAILKMIDTLDESVLEAAFAPSLSILQHYLKRFPASGTIVRRSLEGYYSLSKVAVNTGPLLRRALLTSLCKLSLPQWGKDSNCLLRDHNVAALICLLNVIHQNYNFVDSEWQIIMQTFQELSVMAIASPHLSDSAYVGALSISAVYGRFASFSTCLSDESLSHLVQGLKEIAQLDVTPSVISSSTGGGDIRIPDKPPEDRLVPGKEGDKESTIGEKLMNIGVRAIYGGDGTEKNDDVPLAERTKNSYYHDYQIEFSRRLASSKHPVRIDSVPFSIALLADISMANSFRYHRCGSTLSRELCSLAAESQSARIFAMDTIAMLIMCQQDGSFPITFQGPGKVMYKDPRQNQYLAVEKVDSTTEDGATQGESGDAQGELLTPLCDCIRTVKVASVAEAGSEALHALLETSGHILDGDVWKVIIDAVASLSSPERSSSEWTNSNWIGFRCLKLIVDDFLDQADSFSSARTALLDCCSSFGSSRHDVNTSLTSIGLLWSIADQDAGNDAIDRALSKLVLLSSDSRAEVRNCSVNTLFSCIVGRGQGFTASQWEKCICEMVFGIYDVASAKTLEDDGSATDNKPPPKSRYKVNVHHSRDSAGKQWVATQALVLRGLCRVMRTFFRTLLDTTDDGTETKRRDDDTPWFEKAWNKILSYSFDASTQLGGRDTLDLRSAGVELLVVSNQLACNAGIQAAITPARVGTNMEVVNGALRSVRTPDKQGSDKDSPRRSHSTVTNMWRENLFLDAFDVLDSFREHLESDAAFHESGLSPHMEPTQVQVLSKFAADLSKLYDCCKDEEFLEDKTFSNLASVENLLEMRDDNGTQDATLVVRYVRTVVVVAEKSSGGPDSRFLSQAQRASLDLLRAMASNGSPEAFINLTSLAGFAFFSAFDDNGKPQKGVDILSHETAKVICETISSKSVSDECRILVMGRLLSIFINDANEAPSSAASVDTSIQLLVPLATECLQSVSRLETSQGGQENRCVKLQLLDSLWEKVSMSLEKMLSLPPNGSTLLTIQHAVELVGLVKAASANVPRRHRETFCSILLTGGMQCLEFSRIQNKENSSISDADRQLRRDEILKLFTACFSGVCLVQPEEPRLRAIAEQVVSEALEEMSNLDAGSSIDSLIGVQATLLICQSMQEIEEIETLKIYLFPKLCKLVGADQIELRWTVGTFLASVDVSQVLDETKSRCHHAEQRADEAEKRAARLAKEVQELTKTKEALERQQAVVF